MFTQLHNHTSYSILDGLGSVKDYVSRAKELGMTALAMTDHASVSGAIEFQNECEANDIIPVIGCEFYIVEHLGIKDKNERRNHMTVWVKNQKGWENILKMLTIANLEGMYYRPRIDPNLLLNHCEGLVIGGACYASWLWQDWGKSLLEKLLEKGIDVFMEIQPHNLEEQVATNNMMLELSRKYNLPIIATNDCHYVRNEDSMAQEVLLAIQSRTTWNNPNRWKFQVDGFYLKSQQEMTMAFRVQKNLGRSVYQKAMENTQLVVDLCKDFRIPTRNVLLPQIPQVKQLGMSDNEFLWRLIRRGFREKVEEKGLDIEKYKARVEEEWNLICEKGFERYFLIVWECVHWATKNGIVTGAGRGSAGGSLICYLLGITRVDPIPYNLLFARFINAERADLPDIDEDYSDKDRVREHLNELYGVDNVAGISTYMYIKGRSAIRDVGRVFEIPLKEVDEVCKEIYEEKVTELEDSPIGRQFIQKYPKVYEIAKKIDGTIRSRGQHACGIVIAEEPLTTGTKASLCENKKDGSVMVNFDKHYVEQCGLMKLDVLGLSELNVIGKCLELIKKNHGVDVNLDNISLRDRRCYREFSKGNSVGCFQLGTEGLRKYCQKMGVTCFNDVVNATSLYRPRYS